MARRNISSNHRHGRPARPGAPERVPVPGDVPIRTDCVPVRGAAAVCRLAARDDSDRWLAPVTRGAAARLVAWPVNAINCCGLYRRLVVHGRVTVHFVSNLHAKSTLTDPRTVPDAVVAQCLSPAGLDVLEARLKVIDRTRLPTAAHCTAQRAQAAANAAAGRRAGAAVHGGRAAIGAVHTALVQAQEPLGRSQVGESLVSRPAIPTPLQLPWRQAGRRRREHCTHGGARVRGGGRTGAGPRAGPVARHAQQGPHACRHPRGLARTRHISQSQRCSSRSWATSIRASLRRRSTRPRRAADCRCPSVTRGRLRRCSPCPSRISLTRPSVPQ